MLYSLQNCQASILVVIRPEYPYDRLIVVCDKTCLYAETPCNALINALQRSVALAWGKCQDSRDGNCSCGCGWAVLRADVQLYACINAAALWHGCRCCMKCSPTCAGSGSIEGRMLPALAVLLPPTAPLVPFQDPGSPLAGHLSSTHSPPDR